MPKEPSTWPELTECVPNKTAATKTMHIPIVVGQMNRKDCRVLETTNNYLIISIHLFLN